MAQGSTECLLREGMTDSEKTKWSRGKALHKGCRALVLADRKGPTEHPGPLELDGPTSLPHSQGN